jgi:hypothetical protein
MRKILAGFVVALLIGIPAVYFGVPWWAEQRALRELDATLEMLRRTGAQASHGPASYDLWKRTLKVSDLSIRSGDPAKAALKVGQLVATGIANVDATKFSADRIDITDAEVTGLQAGPTSPAQTYKVPKLTVENFTGPIGVEPRPAAIPGTEDVLTALTAYAAMSASQITIPALSVAVSAPALRGSAAAATADYDAADVMIRNLANGQFKSATIARVNIKGQLPDASTYTGAVEKIQVDDADANALIAVLDPAQSKDNTFRRVYRQATTGPYTVNLSTGVMKADGLQIDDFAIRPSKLSDPAIFALSDNLRNQGGTTTSPADAAAFLDKVATFYEGIKLGKFEARGFSSDLGAGAPIKIGAVRLAALDAGKVKELAVENVAMNPPAGDPASFGRVAFNGIDFAKLMRTLSKFGTAPSPGLEQGLGLLSTIESFELKDFKGVERTTGQPVTVEKLGLSWGKFVGLIPSQIHAASKFTVVVDPSGSDPNLRYLIDAGIKDVDADIDLGATWNENTKSIVLTPVSAAFSKVVGLSAKLTLNNVQDTIFSPNPLSFGMSAAQVEAGTIELTLQDLGGLELVLAQVARDQGMAPDDARKGMVEMIRVLSAASPELEIIGTALARQIENRGKTLNIVLTPKARINLLQAVETARLDPLTLLAQFKVEARTDR